MLAELTQKANNETSSPESCGKKAGKILIVSSECSVSMKVKTMQLTLGPLLQLDIIQHVSTLSQYYIVKNIV